MQYEWDEAKREANLRKHDLDFEDANLVFDAPAKMTIPAKSGTELRLLDVAVVMLGGDTLSLVYTYRGYNVRIISFGKASRRERRLYDDFRAQKPNRLGPRS
jgi:uncharacterized protein